MRVSELRSADLSINTGDPANINTGIREAINSSAGCAFDEEISEKSFFADRKVRIKRMKAKTTMLILAQNSE